MDFYYDAYITENRDVLDFQTSEKLPHLIIQGLSEEESKFLSKICIERQFGILLAPCEKSMN